MTRTVEPVKREPWEHDSEAGFRLDVSFSEDGSGASRELTRLIRRWANQRCQEAISPKQVAAELAQSRFAERFSWWIEDWSARDDWFPVTTGPGHYLTAPQCMTSAQSAIIHQPEVRRMNNLHITLSPINGVR